MNYSFGGKGMKNKRIVVCIWGYFLHLVWDYRKVDINPQKNGLVASRNGSSWKKSRNA